MRGWEIGGQRDPQGGEGDLMSKKKHTWTNKTADRTIYEWRNWHMVDLVTPRWLLLTHGGRDGSAWRLWLDREGAVI